MAKIVEFLETNKLVKLVESVDTWEEAVTLCFEGLLADGYINKEYIPKVIKMGKELHFHFLLAPGLAMPHARPEDGAVKTGVSLLIVKNGVHFEDHQHNPVHCLIGLCAVDGNAHLEFMMEIASLFGDESIIDTLKKANSVEEILEILIKNQ
jgi:PTS system ascorbate-specific IIA component